MKTRVLLFAAIAATTFTFVACGNKQAKTNETVRRYGNRQPARQCRNTG